ncbi:MAG: hypothetical protein K2Z81_04120, partial [Cyanobacteria bacterium]|nr:hypothetical protein [Cyanobacteriota bacterium]
MNEPVTVNLEKISHRFLFPVRATPGRVYISWYDIPMASFELEPLPDGSVTDVVQRWSEKGKPRL